MALTLMFPPDGRYFSHLVKRLAGVSQEDFLEACSDPFILQFPFTRNPVEEPPALKSASTRKTRRLESPHMDATVQLSLESVLAAAQGRKQAEGAKIHRVPKEGEETLLVGRSHKCDLVLGEGTVSNQHAELNWDGARWTVKDLGSQNGTYVDGRRIPAETPQEVRPDQSLWFGSYRTIFITAEKAYSMVAKYGQVAG